MPSGNLHPTAPGAEFSRTSFTRHNFNSLEKDVKRGVNYILGEIVKYWPCGDEDEVETHRLSLVTGYSFYQENFRPHLQRFKNLELHGKTVSPHDHQATGVSCLATSEYNLYPHLLDVRVCQTMGHSEYG
jgi:hypothetical protein